ncbi:MAG: hypothetical protein ACYCW6_25425, partial [Candidatus Xenobia bacterium]
MPEQTDITKYTASLRSWLFTVALDPLEGSDAGVASELESVSAFLWRCLQRLHPSLACRPPHWNHHTYEDWVTIYTDEGVEEVAHTFQETILGVVNGPHLRWVCAHFSLEGLPSDITVDLAARGIDRTLTLSVPASMVEAMAADFQALLTHAETLPADEQRARLRANLQRCLLEKHEALELLDLAETTLSRFPRLPEALIAKVCALARFQCQVEGQEALRDYQMAEPGEEMQRFVEDMLLRTIECEWYGLRRQNRVASPVVDDMTSQDILALADVTS